MVDGYFTLKYYLSGGKMITIWRWFFGRVSIEMRIAYFALALFTGMGGLEAHPIAGPLFAVIVWFFVVPIFLYRHPPNKSLP